MLIKFLLITCLLFWPTFSLATELNNVAEGVENTGSSDSWSKLKDGFDCNLRILTFGTYQNVAESSQNPNNDFFQIQGYGAELELRPDASLNLRRLDLSVKPRMNLEWQAWEQGTQKGETDLNDDWFINEWLARIRLTENLFVSYGRENLQWGPSYLFSPSNPFFSDNGRSNPKQEVPGMDFARIVWLPNVSWTFSLIANLDKGRQEFQFTEFEKASALKLDYTGQEGYAGLILSQSESDKNRLGTFGGRTVTDALLLYGEGSILRDTNILYPKEADNPFGASMEAVDNEGSSLKGTILCGASYTFEIGPTIAMEYVYNGTGYSDDEARAYYRLRKKAADAYDLTGPIRDLSLLTLSKTADPGQRFLRKNYVMFQYVHNDIHDILNLTSRWTQNIDDGSGQLISIVEHFVGDRTQLFAIGILNSGKMDTEFRNFLEYQLMIGLEYTF